MLRMCSLYCLCRSGRVLMDESGSGDFREMALAILEERLEIRDG
jgi:hypothetical protein